MTELVRGKKVSAALAALKFLPKRASTTVAKLISSAAANAKDRGENVDELVVKIIVENAGMLKNICRAPLVVRR